MTRLLLQAAELAFTLLSGGVLSRGGIAVGALVHDERKVLGPAFIEAIRIEREVAVYPRIALTEEVVEGALPSAAVRKLIRRDEQDGVHFVDFLASEVPLTESVTIMTHSESVKPGWRLQALTMRAQEAYTLKEWTAAIREARSHLATRLETEANLKHRAKAEWLARYLDATLARHSEVTVET